tara:strand:+ start:54022 stop:54369 length:348 start_codon:yes stop_codon:yes gene_type:complete
MSLNNIIEGYKLRKDQVLKTTKFYNEWFELVDVPNEQFSEKDFKFTYEVENLPEIPTDRITQMGVKLYDATHKDEVEWLYKCEETSRVNGKYGYNYKPENAVISGIAVFWTKESS